MDDFCEIMEFDHEDSFGYVSIDYAPACTAVECLSLYISDDGGPSDAAVLLREEELLRLKEIVDRALTFYQERLK